MTPGKDGKLNIIFKFEILATNIDQSQILKNICQHLLSLNNVLESYLPRELKTPQKTRLTKVHRPSDDMYIFSNNI